MSSFSSYSPFLSLTKFDLNALLQTFVMFGFSPNLHSNFGITKPLQVPPSISLSLSLSLRPFQSSITPVRSWRLQPVSAQCCCVRVPAWWPTLVRPYGGVHLRTSLTSSSLFLQQSSACLVRLTWMVCQMGNKWPYSRLFLRCDMF